MTDAEKYAKVFRAAADGICSQPWGTWWDSALEAEKKTDPLATVAFGCSREDFVGRRRGEWLRNDQIAATAFLAYEGVASLFEKIVEAEKLG